MKKAINLFLKIIIEWLICSGACCILYSIFLADTIHVKLSYPQWIAIVIILSFALPNPIKPSSDVSK